MTSKEINSSGVVVDLNLPFERMYFKSIAMWLKEIAFQLAVLNERNNQKDKH